MCSWGYDQTGLSSEQYNDMKRLVENQEDVIVQLEKDKQELLGKLSIQKEYSQKCYEYGMRQKDFVDAIKREYNALKKDLESIEWPTKDEEK
jgi:hypothetical protein